MSGMSSEVNLEMGRILIVDDNPNNLKVLSEACLLYTSDAADE